MDTKLFNKPHELNTRVIPETDQVITVARIRELLPAKTNMAVTEELVKLIHNMETDTGLPQELMEEEFMSYLHLIDGMRGAGIKELVNAIKYCNLTRNYDNKEAWSIVFPEKYNALVAANKQVDNHVSMYNGTKLVTAIMKEMLVPVHLIYSQYFHASVKKQFDIMNGKCKDHKGNDMVVSPMVCHLAAKELAALVKPPEESKISININPGAAAMSAQQEMNEQLKALVSQQRRRLDNGESIIDVQAIEGLNFAEVGRGQTK